MRDLEAKLVWKEANWRRQVEFSAPSLNLKSSRWENGMVKKGRELTEGQRGILGATKTVSKSSHNRVVVAAADMQWQTWSSS